MLAETCQFNKFLSVTCQRKHRVQPFHARAACPMQSIRVVACETAIHCVHPSHLACTGYRTQHTPTSVSCVSHAFLGQSCQDRRDCQQAYRAESLRFPECNRTQTETGRQRRRWRTDRQTDILLRCHWQLQKYTKKYNFGTQKYKKKKKKNKKTSNMLVFCTFECRNCIFFVYFCSCQ